MSDQITLAGLDRDGALREAMDGLSRVGAAGPDHEATGDTRAALLRRAALGAGALAGGGALFGLVRPAAAAKSAKQDRAILNYALTLEYLESSFYAEARSGGALSGETLRFAQEVGRHENAHVTLLRSALGSAAVKRPRFDFKGTTMNQATFKATALVLEDTGVMAYNGQVQRIKSPFVLVTAAQIHAVEARHAAWMADILSKDPAPAALQPAATMRQVLAAVGKTGFIAG